MAKLWQWIISILLLLGGCFFYVKTQKEYPLAYISYKEIKAEADDDLQDYLEQWSIPGEVIPPPKQLYALSAAVIDGDTGQVLYEQKGDEHRAMASTTKLMTSILAIEYGKEEDMVTFSEYAAGQPDVQLHGGTGDTFYLGDLLYSLMLESHNDTAVAIAEHIGGSVEGFGEMMNEKAAELGLYHTHFVTPNGLDAPNHYTTAKDLALLGRYCMKNSRFREIVATPSHVVQELNHKNTYLCVNKDQFLQLYPGAQGIKTGFTGDAGYCFVGAATRENRQLISVVLGSGWPPHRSYKWQDTIALMDYGFTAYTPLSICPKQDQLPQLMVGRSIDGGGLSLTATKEVSFLATPGDEIGIRYKLPAYVMAPIKKGEIMGELQIYQNGIYRACIPLIAGEDKGERTYLDCVEYVMERYAGVKGI